MAIQRRNRRDKSKSGPGGPKAGKNRPSPGKSSPVSRKPGPKRSLTHVGGRVETEGNPEAVRILAHALEVRPSTDREDDPSRAHVHGFHSYPARMHPQTAQRLVSGFTPKGGKVLDPFCGSGTVLVEAMVAGLKPAGIDLNPIAVRLARLKTMPRSENELAHLVEQADRVAEFAGNRRKQKAGASRRFPAQDVALFEPHVLLEMDLLALGIQDLGKDSSRPDLEMVFSSLLTRMSRKQGDSSLSTTPRKLAAGFATRQFAGKARELADRLRSFRMLLPSAAVLPATVKLADATKPGKVPGAPFDALVTSPPYASTYDYAEHHALRMRWLGMDATEMRRGELGAKAKYESLDPLSATRQWMAELRNFFAAMRGLLVPDAPVVLVIADSAVGNSSLRAEELVAKAARTEGYQPVARASQTRPHFHGPTNLAFRDRPRMEHALLFRKTDGPVTLPGKPGKGIR